MVGQPCCVELLRAKIGGLQIGELGENIRIRHTRAKHLQNVLHTNPHPANAWLSTALRGIDRDTLAEVHGRTLFARSPFAKLSLEWTN